MRAAGDQKSSPRREVRASRSCRRRSRAARPAGRRSAQLERRGRHDHHRRATSPTTSASRPASRPPGAPAPALAQYLNQVEPQRLASRRQAEEHPRRATPGSRRRARAGPADAVQEWHVGRRRNELGGREHKKASAAPAPSDQGQEQALGRELRDDARSGRRRAPSASPPPDTLAGPRQVRLATLAHAISTHRPTAAIRIRPWR